MSALIRLKFLLDSAAGDSDRRNGETDLRLRLRVRRSKQKAENCNLIFLIFN